jgi:anti-sigma factor RsiW
MAQSALEGGGFRMKHYNVEEWFVYVKGHLSTDDQQMYEAHLYECETCLQLYMECVEKASTLEPELGSEADTATDATKPSYLEEAWIEQIIQRIDIQKKELRTHLNPARKTALYQKPVFQYALAAAITIILMTTGIFQGITGGIEKQPSNQTKQTMGTSYTDQLMDKTVAMLDAIQLKAKLIEKGGVNHD